MNLMVPNSNAILGLPGNPGSVIIQNFPINIQNSRGYIEDWLNITDVDIADFDGDGYGDIILSINNKYMF